MSYGRALSLEDVKVLDGQVVHCCGLGRFAGKDMDLTVDVNGGGACDQDYIYADFEDYGKTWEVRRDNKGMA